MFPLTSPAPTPRVVAPAALVLPAEVFTDFGAYKRSVHPCGMVCHFIHFPREPEIKASVIFPVGSRAERPDEYGGAHALEHLAFVRGPELAGHPSELTFRQAMKVKGSSIGAWTQYDGTNFELTSRGSHFRSDFELMAKMMASPKLDAAAWEAERRVILKELAWVRHDSEKHFSRYRLPNLMYGAQGYDRDIAGEPADVLRLEVGAIERFYKRGWHLNGMHVLVSGTTPSDVDEVLEVLPRAFSLQDPSGRETVTPLTSYPAQLKNRVIVQAAQVEGLGVTVLYPGLSPMTPGFAAAGLLVDILGDQLLSPLFARLRFERELVYTMDVNHMWDDSLPLFSIRFVSDSAEDVNNALSIIREVTESIATNGIDPGLFELARGAARDRLFMFRDSVHNLMVRCLRRHGQPLLPHQIAAAISEVTVDDIKTAAKAIFDGMVVGVYGNVDEAAIVLPA